VNAENVEGALARHGIYCVRGQNQVEVGVMELVERLNRRALHVSRECFGLRDEAEEYRRENRPDGKFAVIRENNHRLDALRYACMERLYVHSPEQVRPNIFGHNRVPVFRLMGEPTPPLGAMQ
jgi:hypothetical protein